jgi:hypothetical protein
LRQAEEEHIIPRLSPGQYDAFQAIWSLGSPLVVTGLHKKLKGNWTPAGFVESHGQEEVYMLNSGPSGSRKVKVAEFFKLFNRKEADRDGGVKVKVSRILHFVFDIFIAHCNAMQDWPPSANFRAKFTDRFDDFMDALPFPHYTRHNGIYNLSAYWPGIPSGFLTFKPDLGK